MNKRQMKTMRRWLPLIATLLVLLWQWYQREQNRPNLGTSPTGELAYVTQIIDGDTVEAEVDGEAVRIRFVGINTPERDDPCWDEATQANEALILHQWVTLVRDTSDTDRYGRLLRYLYRDDLFINAELVRQGWAESRRYSPDTAFYEMLEALETTAKAANVGCHAQGSFE